MKAGKYDSLLHLALVEKSPDTLRAILEPLEAEERRKAVDQIRILNMSVLEFCTQQRPELVDALTQLIKEANSQPVSTASMFKSALQSTCSSTDEPKPNRGITP